MAMRLPLYFSLMLMLFCHAAAAAMEAADAYLMLMPRVLARATMSPFIFYYVAMLRYAICFMPRWR